MTDYSRTPSGLFPSTRTRPIYREPHPVRAGNVVVGAAATRRLVAGVRAARHDPARLRVVDSWWPAVWPGSAAAVLARHGDRGVAVGVAAAAGVGWSVAAIAVAVGWATTGDWPLW